MPNHYQTITTNITIRDLCIAVPQTAASSSDGSRLVCVHQVVLVDPMCGSGTFLIEAALMAAHAAPGLSRGVC